ncbi:uncharacterized protein JN550_008023 [Neoarthrinium moseri]|uniref:uncharacterized protein n=1 Tax=Neoarthrinium moseri TaxID=1658444 RepID=UPI001FDDD354|nr:uncharacterized protein JN550_008023 [Neoarthrinium moseri]KAI1866045.1 hypothetical protein JN550_008023 [Neoarthrinium moseri]
MKLLKLLFVYAFPFKNNIFVQTPHGVEFEENQVTTGSLDVINGFERLQIQTWGQNAIRVRSSVFQHAMGNEPGALLDAPVAQDIGRHSESPQLVTYFDNATLRSGLLEVTVSRNRLNFWRITDRGDEKLFGELWPQHGRIARDWSYDRAGVSSRPSATFSFTSDDDEQIFGLGQHQYDNLDNKGRHYQSETTIPSYISSKTYGFLWNVPSMGHVSIDRTAIQWVSEATTVVDYVVSVAEPGDFNALIQTHTSITGRSPRFPAHGRGYIQSKARYANQSELLRVARGFNVHDVPVSMIQIDAPHWTSFGDFAFDSVKFPSPGELVKAVGALTKGARIIVNLWPLMDSSSSNWLEYFSLGFLVGSPHGLGVVEYFNSSFMHLIDYTNPLARLYTWKQIYDNYYSIGIKDFLLDCTEGGGVGEGFSYKSSSVYALQGVPFPRPNLIYSIGTQAETGALYPFYAQKMIADGVASVDNDNSPSLSFSRSAWLGSQRLPSVLWGGDVNGSWEAFRSTIVSGLNIQLSGISWWASDIGGYYANLEYHGNISDPAYRELYTRWFQYGTLSPVMRAHGRRKCLPEDLDGFESCPNEPWAFGNTTFTYLRKFIQLRYALDSYLEFIFDTAAQYGTPLQRPLLVDFGKVDPYTILHAEDLKYQFMFGPNLLVAPVVIPGTTEWTVYLPSDEQETDPAGSVLDNATAWRDWWTDKVFAGGTHVVVEASLDIIPLFYRGTKDDILSGKMTYRK